MPSNPVEAGRKGGQSRSAAKLAAARRNGFQPVQKTNPTPEPAKTQQPVLIAPKFERQQETR